MKGQREMMDIGEDIVQFLKDFSDRDSQKRGKDLAKIFNISMIELRWIVNRFREEGEPICATNYGYFYARKSEDVFHTICSLQSRINKIAKSLEGLNKALLELDEQEEERW